MEAGGGDAYDPGGMTGEVMAKMRAQEPLVKLAGAFAELGSAGYIGSRIDTSDNSVTVHWHGELAPRARALVEAARSTSIVVRVRAAPFSKATLRETEQRISSVGRQIGLTLIGRDPSGNGFHLQFGDSGDRDCARVAIAALQSGEAVPPSLSLPAPLAAYEALVAQPGGPPIRIETEPARLVQF